MNTIKFQVAALAAAVSTMAAVSAQANDVATDSANQPINLETVTVTALPGDGTATQAQQPVTLLSGEDLERERRASLGDTLSQQPGIQNSGFGAAVGRPVIRGMGGARIKVLQDGLEAADASSVSPDHAVAVESDTAQQIEVLRGPATLLYGSGALGGVVNVVSAPLEQNSDETHVGLSYSTADTGRQVTAGHQS
ncbi:MAG: TonB-dependent receptor plug domain-containing protein, partial [Thalassolituus sp.]